MLDSSSVIDLDEDHEYARYDISSRVLFNKSLLAQQVRDHSMCRITATPAHILAPELVHPFFCPPLQAKTLPWAAQAKTEKSNSDTTNPGLEHDDELIASVLGNSEEVQPVNHLPALRIADAATSGDVDDIRARLLRRIHLSLLRHHVDGGKKKDAEEKGPSDSNTKANDQPRDIMLAASIRMSLALVKVLGPSNPALFNEITSTLTTLLISDETPMCLKEYTPGQPSALCGVLDDLQTFLSNISSGDSEPAVRRDAIALLALLSLERASVIGLVAVADALLKDPTLAFSEDILIRTLSALEVRSLPLPVTMMPQNPVLSPLLIPSISTTGLLPARRFPGHRLRQTS